MSGPGAGVTVVVPVWDDYVEFLGEAVESVRRNAPRAPIVVVDNASAIPVPELEGCTIVRAPRRLTVGAARNLGLERVASEYVVFLDADDMLLDGALEFMQGRIAADAGVAVSATSILEGESGERHRTPRRFTSRLARWPPAFALANSVWSLLPIQGCAILRSRQVREAGGYADADLGEDWVLTVSLAWRGRIEVSERLGRYYRSTEESIDRRARTPRELRASARRVRERMRADPAVPTWARALLPPIAALQLTAIHLLRPVYLAARRLMTRPDRTSVEL
jgi:glycosyltransferase involved in cell wall biosynthesis